MTKLLLLASLALPLSALAGQAPAPAPAPLATPPAASDWWFNSTSYGWLTDIQGDAGLLGYKAPVSIGMDDVLDSLDLSYMSYAELGYKKWSVGVDVVYAKLSQDETFAVGPISAAASLELQQAFVTTRLQYRAVDNAALKLDVFTGFRWNYFDLDLALDTNYRDASASTNEDWFDLIVGARALVALNDKWYFQGTGDIGGFGVESDLTWQALAGFGYQFTPRIAGVFGYRAMGVDYDKGGFLMDTVSHGPALGLSFSF